MNYKSCVSTPNLARFVVQKIGIKGAVVPPADFLLESDKRGSPPKSEKRQLLETQFKHLGGAGRGVQPFLREKTSESKRNKIVGDSRISKIDCHESLRDSRNDDIFLDSSLRATRYAQNDEFMDYHA